MPLAKPMHTNETEHRLEKLSCVRVPFFVVVVVGVLLSLFCYWYKMYFECFFRFDLCIDDD